MSSISGLGSTNNIAPFAATGGTPAGGTSGTSSSSSNSSLNNVDSLGTTFMSLLAQELQNQDPTQPVDSTEMVGQMISLTQLDQVASINQLLTNQFSSSNPTTPAASQAPSTGMNGTQGS